MILLDAISNDLAYAGTATKAITLVLAGVTALIAALKIYNRWQMGEIENSQGQSITSEIMHWGAAAAFFLVGRVILEIIL